MTWLNLQLFWNRSWLNKLFVLFWNRFTHKYTHGDINPIGYRLRMTGLVTALYLVGGLHIAGFLSLPIFYPKGNELMPNELFEVRGGTQIVEHRSFMVIVNLPARPLVTFNSMGGLTLEEGCEPRYILGTTRIYCDDKELIVFLNEATDVVQRAYLAGSDGRKAIFLNKIEGASP